MAARAFQNGIKTLQREPVKIWAKGTGAATDALTALESAGDGVVSIDQTGTGLYTVLLADKYAALLMLSGTVIDPTAPDEWVVQVASELVSTSKTISIQVFKGGALTDLTTDEKLMLEITLKNTAQTV
jgi:hypothetical protein